MRCDWTTDPISSIVIGQPPTNLQEEDDQIAMTWNDPFNNAYKKLFFNKAGTKLLGGILVGDASDYTTLLASTPPLQTCHPLLSNPTLFVTPPLYCWLIGWLIRAGVW